MAKSSRNRGGEEYVTPRWVKATLAVATALVVLLVMVTFTGLGGSHGPARHIAAASAVGHPK